MPGLPIPGSDEERPAGKSSGPEITRQVMVAYVRHGAGEKAFIVSEGRTWGPFVSTEELREAWRELKAAGSI